MEEQKVKALKTVKDKINKDFGKGSIMTLSEKPDMDMSNVISTGSIGLNFALGVGGLPKGRITEIYGPESSGKTTIAIHVIAEAQKKGGLCAFIDVEHAFDKEYAKNLGVNIDELEISQPDYGEQALEIADRLVTSGVFDVIVIDSVAALVPKGELDGEMGDNKMGLHARLMSQACRKLTASISKTNTLVIFINQLREKIGVMFGCFSYNNPIHLADGTTMKIGKIVNQKLPLEVLSLNTQTGKIEPKKIINWFNNGKANKYLRISSRRFDGVGKNYMEVTENHTILTPIGEVSASELRKGDKIYTKAYKIYNNQQYEVALGSIIGDGSLRNNGGNTKLRIGHGINQIAYCKRKQKVFSSIKSYSGKNAKEGWSFETTPSSDLNNLYNESYSNEGRILSNELINNIKLEGVAIWYMDDASFAGSYKAWGKGKTIISVKSYALETIDNFIKIFERLKLPIPKINYKYKRLEWYGEDSYNLQEKLSPYIYREMSYKIHPKLRADIDTKTYLEQNDKNELVLIETEVTEIQKVEKEGLKFDIEVEGNNNYFVGGILVHNSPEVTTGGNALKFYASVRLDIRRSTTEANSTKNAEGVKMGNLTTVKVIKNKVAPPFRSCQFNIIYGKGIDKKSEILEIATDMEVINKSGSWYSYKDNRLGQGREEVFKLLSDNPEMFEEIKGLVESKLIESLEKKEDGGII